MLCSYGCNQPALFIFKNGKGCCASSANKCPHKRALDSTKKKGREIPAAIRQKAYAATRGKPSWSSGKTKATDDRLAVKAEKLTNRYAAGDLVRPMCAHTDESKQKIRQAINKRYAEGWMPKAGRCKKIEYVSSSAGTVLLDGSWELISAKWFDSVGLTWRRNTDRFHYVDPQGKDRTYTPDFYVEEWDSFVEVKGYETLLDRCKWAAFPHKLLVWKKDVISRLKEGNLSWC